MDITPRVVNISGYDFIIAAIPIRITYCPACNKKMLCHENKETIMISPDEEAPRYTCSTELWLRNNGLVIQSYHYSVCEECVDAGMFMQECFLCRKEFRASDMSKYYVLNVHICNNCYETVTLKEFDSMNLDGR